jgi:predicted PurR-regulated permease PerM
MTAVRLPRGPTRMRNAILVGLWAFVALTAVLFPGPAMLVLGAALLAYLIEPLVRVVLRARVRGRALPRWAAVLVVYGIVLGAIYAGLAALAPRVYEEALRLAQSARAEIQAFDQARIEAWLGPYLPEGVDIKAALTRELAATAGQLHEVALGTLGWLQQAALRAVGWLFGFVLLLVVTAMISADVERVKGFVFALVPMESREDFDRILARIDRALGGVVRGQFIIVCINGALTFLGLWLLDVRYAVVLSLVAAVLMLVPIFGTIVSSVPIVAIALTDSFPKALGVLAWILGIHALEAYLLNPRILGHAARVHPVLVIFALLAGERTYGFVGALLAVPAASVLVAVFKFFHRRALELSGEKLPEGPEEREEREALERRAAP